MGRTRNFNKFTRRKASRRPKRTFYLLCEGKLTEVQYFSDYRSICHSRIEIDVTGAAGVPKTLLEKAVSLGKTKRLIGKRKPANSFEEGDEIWIVFDRDDHPKYIETIRKSKDLGIGAAYSNPCFELWLIYHFENLNAAVDRHEIQSRLSELLPDYDPKHKCGTLGDVIAQYEQAEKRSAKSVQDRLAEGGDEATPPQTNVGTLTSRLREKPTFKPK